MPGAVSDLVRAGTADDSATDGADGRAVSQHVGRRERGEPSRSLILCHTEPPPDRRQRQGLARAVVQLGEVRLAPSTARVTAPPVGDGSARRAGQLAGQLGPPAPHAAGPPDRPGRRAGRRPRAPPDGRSPPGHVAGDTADDEDREHREQRPDAAAIAQRPTARRVGPCHGARAGEHEQPDRKAGRAERGRPVRRHRAPPAGTSAAVSRASRTAVATAAAAAPETSSRALRGAVTARKPWHCRRWAHGRDGNSAATRRGSPTRPQFSRPGDVTPREDARPGRGHAVFGPAHPRQPPRATGTITGSAAVGLPT